MTPADLRAYRLDVLHLTQVQLAALLGVQSLSISRWERGASPIPAWLHYALYAIAIEQQSA